MIKHWKKVSDNKKIVKTNPGGIIPTTPEIKGIRLFGNLSLFKSPADLSGEDKKPVEEQVVKADVSSPVEAPQSEEKPVEPSSSTPKRGPG